jgi:hypothetical protein
VFHKDLFSGDVPIVPTVPPPTHPRSGDVHACIPLSIYYPNVFLQITLLISLKSECFSSLSTYYFNIVLVNSLAAIAIIFRDYVKCFSKLNIKQAYIAYCTTKSGKLSCHL